MEFMFDIRCTKFYRNRVSHLKNSTVAEDGQTGLI